jgi:hypothetical protein
MHGCSLGYSQGSHYQHSKQDQRTDSGIDEHALIDTHLVLVTHSTSGLSPRFAWLPCE